MAQIIPKNPLAVENNWQKDLSEAFSDPELLLEYLGLDTHQYREHIKARKLFPMRVPKPFAQKMQRNDFSDPLLRQVFPLSDEFVAAPGYTQDPLDEQNNAQPGILHKYQSRVLLIVRGGCAVNCRYCFRRHFPYADNALNKSAWQTSLDYIEQDQAINEVIYSGGDPLMANDDHLRWLTEQIAKIPHVKRLRIHTRLPVVIPDRVTPSLVDVLVKSGLQTVMVLHINHANELDTRFDEKMAQLKQAGVTLLNQAVLLRGVNDSADALVQLSERLFEAGILPYYLHVLDRVQGAAHFDVSEAEARVLIAESIKRLPGFLVPKLVREIADQPGKTPLDLHLHP